VELTSLRYFRAIAHAGHMTHAARALGVTQPALSAVVKKLETELGAELFHRTGRGVQLTDAGRIFLGFADEAILAAEAGKKSVRELMGLERGSVRVGGGATAIMHVIPPAISAIHRDHPGIRFYIREAGSAAVTQAVLSGELDLGIVTLPVRAEDEGRLIAKRLIDDELRLIVPPGHRLAGKRTFDWADLSREPRDEVIGFEAGSAVRDVIDSAARAAGVTLAIVMELRSIASIQGMVAAGVGVGFVSRFALGKGEGLACRSGALTRTLALIRRSDRVPSAAAAAFEKRLVGKARAARG
jgi:LysR family cyn operon transcriptional activator